jgi:predicted transcriptional regulator
MTNIPTTLARCPNISAHSKVLVSILLTLPAPAQASYDDFMEWMGVSRGTVAKAIKSLVAMNIIINQDNGRHPNSYYILPQDKWLIN